LQRIWGKIQQKIIIATLMQPLKYGLRSQVAKDHSNTRTAAAPRNLDADVPMHK
jgi:hypothetical protein